MPSTFTNGNTADYINQLKTDKHTLVTNLVAKGVTSASDSETFTTLVAKVNDISGGASVPVVSFPALTGQDSNSGTVYGGGISYSDLQTFLNGVDQTAVSYIGDIILTDASTQTATTFTLPGTWSALRGFKSFEYVLRIPTLTTLDLSGIGTLLAPLNQQSIDTSSIYNNPNTASLTHATYSSVQSDYSVTTINLSGMNVTASINVGGTQYYGGNLNSLFDKTYYGSMSEGSCFRNVTSIDMSNMDFDKLYRSFGSMGSIGMNDAIFCRYDYSSGNYVTRFSNNGCTIYVKNATQQTWVQDGLNNYGIGSYFNVVVR